MSWVFYNFLVFFKANSAGIFLHNRVATLSLQYRALSTAVLAIA